MTAIHGSVQSILFIEELALNGWPALTTLCYDGWLLRLANGYTRRANSVSPLYDSSLDLNAKIRYCEAIYAQYGQSAIFKLTEATNPPDLDQVLNDQGYTVASPSTVMVLDSLNDQPAVRVVARSQRENPVLRSGLCAVCAERDLQVDRSSQPA